MSIDICKEVARLVARHAKGEGANATAIDSLTLWRHTSLTPSIHTTQSPIFGMAVQGRRSIELGGKTQQFGSGDYLFVSFDVPVASRVIEASAEKPNLGLGMAISSVRLHDVLARVDIPPHPTATQSACSVIVARAGLDLLDATLRLLRLLDTPGDIRPMAPLIEQEIIYRLLSGPYGGCLLRVAEADSPANGVAKAIAWLGKHYVQQLRIAELAELVGMSESSLHHHFKAITRLTPMQYQKQLRLHEARRLIQIERRNIGSAGYAVGYQSRSQFSREYSRLYGVSPQRHVTSSNKA
ncbi:AraC family transcriptional regulator [Cupriavidus sp. CV2]|uniref:AraC family transcriptional regulator n=1 Tax=Cupriavidus ulmosensis TaxID=3065913 RepID=UPI00296AC2FF|nr:AraC family transcriptional regulator [Cupriavidus sp. CV2]MDW3687986.1 AraC family transcriptional regulator [Cupriavidus sp. CV2]